LLRKENGGLLLVDFAKYCMTELHINGILIICEKGYLNQPAAGLNRYCHLMKFTYSTSIMVDA
jgi:hypothetical protein